MSLDLAHESCAYLGAMTADEYRAALDALGLTQAGAGHFLGYNERTSRRWADGELEVPLVVEKFLRLMLARHIKPDQVDRLTGATIPTPRRVREAHRVEDLVRQIGPILHGMGPELQSAALADLTAMWLAGNVALDPAGGIDRERTDTLREDLLRLWLKTMHDLVPVNERVILEKVSRAAH